MYRIEARLDLPLMLGPVGGRDPASLDLTRRYAAEMEYEEGCAPENGVDIQEANPNDPCFLDEDNPFYFSARGLYAVYNCVDTDGNDYLKYVPVITNA